VILLYPLDILLVFKGKSLVIQLIQPIQEPFLVCPFHLQIFFQGGNFVAPLEAFFNLHVHYLPKVDNVYCQLIHLGLQ
jgi:hypothetical protein